MLLQMILLLSVQEQQEERRVEGRLKDVEVYYKVKDETWYVRTGVIEVKDLNSSKACVCI